MRNRQSFFSHPASSTVSQSFLNIECDIKIRTHHSVSDYHITSLEWLDFLVDSWSYLTQRAIWFPQCHLFLSGPGLYTPSISRS